MNVMKSGTLICILLLFCLQWRTGHGLSRDGWILLTFKMKLLNSESVLKNWNANDDHPCHWTGVQCDLNNTYVTNLNLPYRHLSGPIPPVLGKLNRLRRLGLHENEFFGPIPPELGNLTSLRALYLKANKLTGQIPDELAQLSNLEILDVSRNQLTGSIPDSLGNLSKLYFLNVSANFLEGEIPTGALSDFTNSSFAGNLGLCGPQVNYTCQNDVSPSPAPVPGPADPVVSAPSPCTGTPEPEAGSEDAVSKNTSTRILNSTLIIISAVAVVLGFLCFSCSFLYFKKQNPSKKLKANGRDQVKGCTVASSKLVMFHGDLPYASKDIVKKIETLDDTDIIGSGGFGTVYRLVMEDGNWFAVKKIGKCGLGSARLFERELEILGSFKHRNLVNLRGYCNSPASKLLIYDYLPYGSLDEFLHEREPHETPLSWVARLKIAVGTARALAYLHHDCSPRIIHRDIKSSNILLDSNLEPHVSDFGLAKLLDDDESHVTTIVAGTFGYLAPEYMQSGRATEKADVYSYGVVLLELLSGKRPTDTCFVEKGLNVVGWVGSCIRENRHKDIFDPKCPSPQKESMENVLQIAIVCIAADPEHRPSMEQVVQMLETDTFSPCPSDLEYDTVSEKEADKQPSLMLKAPKQQFLKGLKGRGI
ncbi:unnamed protein product [Calypogeia fissa]